MMNASSRLGLLALAIFNLVMLFDFIHHNFYSNQSTSPRVFSVKNQKVQKANSWYMTDKEFEETIVEAKGLAYGNKIEMPKYNYTMNMLEIYNDYLLLVPLSGFEDIRFYKSIYRDMNMLFICDKGDERNGCDIYLDKTYDSSTLKEKTFEIFESYCLQEKQFKVVAKVDSGSIIDKFYLYQIVKFMADNSDKRIYFGNPVYLDFGAAMTSRFYAMTQSLMDEYCSCEHPLLDVESEDMWFGKTLNNCLKSKNYKTGNSINLLTCDLKYIEHNTLEHPGVSIKIGSDINPNKAKL